VEQNLPDQSFEEYIPILFYKARAHIALGDTEAVTSLIPTDTENLALKTVAVFAKYISASQGDAALEELRDLCVEIEGNDVEATEREKGWVRVVAGTAFARANEIEEALETLGAESTTENLEA
jgi:coatomer subunit epsilon